MAELSRVLDDTIRQERGRIIAGLLRLCKSLDAAEDALHEAVLAAMQAWRAQVPNNPGAWLMTAAKNSAQDALRHRAVAESNATVLEMGVQNQETIDSVSDDYLRLIFACCHPALSKDNQIALTLKVVAGFSTEEIARAFVCSDDTVSQRVLRAKRVLADLNVPYSLPTRGELEERVAAVLGVIYAMFNEGHTARSGPLMRLDLQVEAFRLGRLVTDLLPREPEAFGLIALMAFSAARARARVAGDGVPILLASQDRSQWDRELIHEGLMALQYARTFQGRSHYVLQAELAAVHVTAVSWEHTDWAAIVTLYDALSKIAPSPIVMLNRAVAVSMLEGPRAGLAALIPLERPLAQYHYFHATRADLLERAGQDGRAAWKQAIALATNDGERLLLQSRLAQARSRQGPAAPQAIPSRGRRR